MHKGDSMDNRNQRPVRPIRFNISPKLVIWIVIAVVAILMVLGSFFVVDQTEQAVVLRFGRYHRTVGPGLQTKIPLGIERNTVPRSAQTIRSLRGSQYHPIVVWTKQLH